MVATVVIIVIGLLAGSVVRATASKGWSFAVLALTLICAIKTIPITSPAWSIQEWAVAGVVLAAFAVTFLLVDRASSRRA